jgi:hypothetical protein
VWPVTTLIGVVIVVWLALVALHLVEADHHLRVGITDAGRAKDELSLANLTTAGPDSTLAAAATAFHDAHNETDSWWMAPLRILPIVGTQLRSVDALSAAAGTVASAGEAALEDFHQLVVRPHTTPTERAGLVTGLANELGVLRKQVDSVTLGPLHGLISPLVRDRDKFAHDLARLEPALDKVDAAAAAASQLFQGDHTYLLIAANNAEMRAGSGMALEVGDLRIDDGKLTLGGFRLASQMVHRYPGLAATGDLAARWGFDRPTLDFREILLSPQFPANAALAVRMWQARTGQRVDGVVLVDIAALDDLLGVTGPVSEAGTTLTAADAVAYLLEGQYVGIPTNSLEEERHQRLGLLAAAVFHQLEAPGTPLASIARVLGQAVSGRHLIVWSTDPASEADWLAAGAGGAVDGDDLLLALDNEGANKLDPYQQVTAQLGVVDVGADSRVTVTVNIRNTTPPTLTGYAAGGSPGAPPARVYTGVLALDLPSYAGYVHVLGDPPIEAIGPDYGAQVIAVRVSVPDGESRTVSFRFTLIGGHGALTVQPSARLPATSWTADGPAAAPVRFTDATAYAFTW